MSPTQMVITLLVIVAVVGGAFALSKDSAKDTSGDAMMEKTDEGAMMEKDSDDAMMKEGEESMMEKDADDAMMAKDEESMMEKDAMMSAKGTYEAYSPEKLALAKDGDVVLFFHADWCPVCRGLEKEITADVSKISDGVHILKLDYDKEIALRQKYGVTVQHTFVQVDMNGNLIAKWSDETDLSGVLARIQ